MQWLRNLQLRPPRSPADTVLVAVFCGAGRHRELHAGLRGTFEGAITGWTLNDAAVAPGNEPWQVDGSSDDQSLRIASGGSAVSPTFCVSNLTPSWRFFAKAANGSSSSVLHVAVQVSTPGGHVMTFPLTNLGGDDYDLWAATPSLILGRVLPPGLSVNVRFVFTADSNGSGWSIDDVFVDPYAK